MNTSKQRILRTSKHRHTEISDTTKYPNTGISKHRDGGIRTRDPLNPIQVRYRAALRPVLPPRAIADRTLNLKQCSAVFNSPRNLISAKAGDKSPPMSNNYYGREYDPTHLWQNNPHTRHTYRSPLLTRASTPHSFTPTAIKAPAPATAALKPLTLAPNSPKPPLPRFKHQSRQLLQLGADRLPHLCDLLSPHPSDRTTTRNAELRHLPHT